jgi:hypothetical protein
MRFDHALKLAATTRHHPHGIRFIKLRFLQKSQAQKCKSFIPDKIQTIS